MPHRLSCRWTRVCCRPSACATRSRANGSSRARGGSRRSRCSRRASTCAWATTRGRCAAASCRTATRRSRRRSRISRSRRIDLRDGATLERDRPYLIPLIEELRLPDEIRAKANPKSSTGRLDVFTRVLTDRNHRFDEIAGRLPRQALPGGRPAHVRDPREDGPRAEPGAADLRRRAGSATGSSWRCTARSRCSTVDSEPLSRLGAVARRRAVPEPRRVRLDGQHRRLPREEEQPADRPHAASAP